MRFFLFFLLLLASPLRALDCTGTNLLPRMDTEDRLRLEAAAGITPYASGLFWRATKGDTTLDIFGTYHLFHDLTDTHLAALLPHARAADFSYFEMNHPDMQAFEKRAATDPDMMFTTDGPTLPELLSQSDWTRLRAAMSDRGIPSFMAAKFKPIFVSMMLSMSPCQIRAQSAGDKGIDARLSRTLHEEGHDTRSIEDTQTIVRILDSFSRDEQIGMIKLSLDLPLNADDIQQTMLDMYYTGDVAKLWEYGRLLSLKYGGPTAAEDFSRFDQVLLTNRNRAWVDRIAETAPGKHVFIAVGGGHLPGKNGILNLLAEQGYTITQRSLAQP